VLRWLPDQGAALLGVQRGTVACLAERLTREPRSHILGDQISLSRPKHTFHNNLARAGSDFVLLAIVHATQHNVAIGQANVLIIEPRERATDRAIVLRFQVDLLPCDFFRPQLPEPLPSSPVLLYRLSVSDSALRLGVIASGGNDT
jgi:hypothetical protein